MPGSYEDFFAAIRQRESSNNYTAENGPHFLGAYQFGEAALVDLGYVNRDADPNNNDYSGGWTGKNGITSKAAFLANPGVQDSAAGEWWPILWQRARNLDLEFYDGQTLNGYKLTKSGMIAASHLVGTGALRDFIRSGGLTIRTDGNGTPITQYIQLFAGYDTPASFVNNEEKNNAIRGGSGQDKLFGFDGADTLDAGGAADTVSGGLGNDSINGGAGDDSVDGGAGDDQVNGGPGNDTLLAGDGNDTVTGGGGADVIHLGNGNDSVSSADNGTMVWGEGGADTINAGVNDVRLMDADANDKVMAADKVLTGAIHWKGSASPYATTLDGLFGFGLNHEGDLVVHNFAFNTNLYIGDYVGGPGAPYNAAGLYVAEIEIGAYRLIDPHPAHLTALGTWEALLGAYMKANFGESHWAGVDPLVLDLDGDGLELTSTSAGGVRFDIDGDGYAERTGWTGADDGILVRDLNNDGKINDVHEMFGGPGVSGYTALAAFDANGDGKIDASDPVFADLRVWRDADQDLQTDPGELLTLAQAGIASIALASTASTAIKAGNALLATGAFTRTDGSTGTTAEVSFHVDNQSTAFLGDHTVSAAAAALPDLKGYGTLPDLRVAMTLDPTLQTVVSAHLGDLGSLDLATLREAAKPILLGWALSSPVSGRPPLVAHQDVPILIKIVNGLETVSDFAFQQTDAATGEHYWALASGGVVHDAQGAAIAHPTLAQVEGDATLGGSWSTLGGDWIGFFERYLGEDLPLDGAPTHGPAAAAQMTDVINGFWNTLNSMAVRLAGQGPLRDYFAGLSYDVAQDGFTPTTARQLAPSFEAVFAHAATLGAGAEAWLQSWRPVLSIVVADYHQPDELANTFGFMFSNIVAGYESSGLSLPITTVAGALGLPADLVRAGPGVLTGGSDADLFYLSSGDQTASGGMGPDTYVIGHHFGHDVIDEFEAAGQTHSEDVVRFANIASTDVTATRVGIDLVISVNGTDDVLTIKNHFDGRTPGLGGGGDLSDDTGVDVIVFSDGVSWTPFDVARAVSKPDASAQTIAGTATVDWLDGGAGDDSLAGADDADVYVYGRGYGSDVISDHPANMYLDGPDYVLFKPGVTADDLQFTRQGASDDLTITIAGETGSLKILGQFAATYTGPFGKVWLDRIETLRFDDGSELDWAEVARRVLAQSETDGNDQIYGFSLEDTLAGGLGDDFMSGGNENDTYVYELGDGHDTIDENLGNILSGMTDQVVFGEGIDPAAVQVMRLPNSNDLKLTFADGGTLVVKDQFQATNTGPFGLLWMDRIETFRFANGEVWDAEAVIQKALASAGTTGADTIDGFWRQDRLDGGAGDDLLRGAEESDVYVFGRGYGHDTVYDSANLLQATDTDAIEMKPDVAPGDIVFERALGSADFTLRIAGTQDRITLQNQNYFFNVGGYSNQIEEVRFSDGTVWTAAFLREEFVRRSETSGADTIEGFSGADTLDGGAGNDVLYGRDGGDTYRFDIGGGQDIIRESVGLVTQDLPDQVVFGAAISRGATSFRRVGDNLEITFAGVTDKLTVEGQFNDINYYTVESFRFADGSVLTEADIRQLVVNSSSGADTLLGTEANDTLDGGAGNDSLVGGAGFDTYRFGVGYGQDVIRDGNSSVYNHDHDVVEFGPGITPGMAHAVVNGWDLTLTFTGLTDKLTILEQFLTTYTKIEYFRFSDGTELTERQFLDIALSGSATAAADTINGTAGADVLNALAGADRVLGQAGDDLLIGGLDNDTLDGGDGSDRYDYDAGDGADVISDTGTGVADSDALEFGAAVTPAMLRLAWAADDPDDLIVTFSGQAGSVRIDGFSSGDIETFHFADGTTWTRGDVMAAYATQAATPGADAVRGSIGGEALSGAAGADTITANAGDDTLTGGAGNDSLVGGTGDDRYVWARGDGADTVTEAASGGSDTLVLTGVNPADVSVTRNGLDVTLTVSPGTVGGSDGGSINLLGELDDLNNRGIERIQFADGSLWRINDLRLRLVSPAGTAGNDVIAGTSSADILAGGGGSDSLNGGSGDDAYLWSRGDGADVITEASNAGAGDQLILLNVNLADVTLSRNGGDVTLVIAPSTTGGSDGGAVQIVQGLDENFDRGIDRIVFADGSTWTRADLRLKLLAQASTAGADTITGFNTNDTLTGGAGNDALAGAAGDDTYNWARGDGADTITEASNAGSLDRLVLQGVNPADVTLSRNGGDVTLVIAPSTTGGSDGGAVQIVQGLDENFDRGIDRIVFADGSAWTRADLRLKLLAQASTSGADTITGFNTNDTLTGGAGNDALAGAAGDDTYNWARGDGADTITEASNAGALDRLVLQGVNPADVTLSRNGGDVTLVIAPSATGGSDGGAVQIVQGLDENFDRGIDRIVFADGSAWTRADLRLKLLAQASTAGADTITGFNTNDTLTGGAGNDALAGAAGDDTYNWARGDGADTITEASNAGALDRLVLQGVNPSDVVVARAGSGDVLLTVAPSAGGATDGGAIRIVLGFDDFFDRGIDQVAFANGATWTRADLRAQYLAQAATTGADSITGFNTNDTLSGGAGADTLAGGTGADVFRYQALTDSTVATPDLITDFVAGTDHIDLSGIDANTSATGDQAFSFIGSAAFSNVAGQLRWALGPSGARTVYGDVDGDGVADFAIQVTGTSSFQATDFIL